ncbi:CPBP family intramembrane glutamic endopeptidase [Natranaeroarchaeum sulfidigenes]|uniref:CPBP family intramembrane glutamic endopeptidase n=1 Tax=Natranaeroarchaeum sulfidigenes TaxID=2784880 RepID=UPI001EE5F511|nr:type II CAAX endopeptidase family protein [Natranaeroarchaeum sulfidigenes]
MTQWVIFAAVTLLVTALVLVFARQTAALAAESDVSADGPEVDGPDADPDTEFPEETPESELLDDALDTASPGEIPATDTGGKPTPSRQSLDLSELSKRELFANVALTQGVFGGVLVAAAWWTGVPASALGIEWTAASVGLEAVAFGAGVGVALYVANAAAAIGLERIGVGFDELLRELLAPDSAREWAVLLLFVLPTVALFEELLFRAALIGALSTGFGVSPWLLAVLSSVAFGLGHGLQGPGGILVTGVLGFVLAAVFILTGSLLVVVVAHYVINAAEFVVHEGLGIDPRETLGSK